MLGLCGESMLCCRPFLIPFTSGKKAAKQAVFEDHLVLWIALQLCFSSHLKGVYCADLSRLFQRTVPHSVLLLTTTCISPTLQMTDNNNHHTIQNRVVSVQEHYTKERVQQYTGFHNVWRSLIEAGGVSLLAAKQITGPRGKKLHIIVDEPFKLKQNKIVLCDNRVSIYQSLSLYILALIHLWIVDPK